MFYVIERFLRETIVGLESVSRWQPYVDAGSTPENDLQHSLSTVFLTILVLELLKQDPPNIKYCEYEVLACAALHDLGEINVGDTIYKRKNKSSVRREHESFTQQTLTLPAEIRERVRDLYMIQYQNGTTVTGSNIASDDTKKGSGLVFEFIERTGYLLYAIGEYNRSKKNIGLLVQVLRNQIEHIKRLLVLFPAGRRIFSDALIEWMEGILESNRDKHIEK